MTHFWQGRNGRILVVLLAAGGYLLYLALTRAAPNYRAETGIPYCLVDGRQLTLNAFLPVNTNRPTPALVEIHGGWWMGGQVATVPPRQMVSQGVAFFSIEYRLGQAGGFPQSIGDCRNAIRFLRKNAARFNIDPDRMDVMGGSAGGHLSLMVAMVPEDFDDGGPTPELAGISAKVSGCFSYIPATDFLRFWEQGPADVVTNASGAVSFRNPAPNIPNDSRPHLRLLFHGVTPDTAAHRELYQRMCPLGQIRKDVPPLLICDGENDPVIPGLQGKSLYEKLQTAGADVTYWMTKLGGHTYPSGPGFQDMVGAFLVRTLKPDPADGRH